jgi:hypothetical protein
LIKRKFSDLLLQRYGKKVAPFYINAATLLQMAPEIANDLANDQWIFATHNYVLFAKDKNTL